jgi:hypothetical protein
LLSRGDTLGDAWWRKLENPDRTISLKRLQCVVNNNNNGPGLDTVFNRNEYQEYFLEGKGGQLTIVIMALDLTQCLTEMSIRNISWGVKTAS